MHSTRIRGRLAFRLVLGALVLLSTVVLALWTTVTVLLAVIRARERPDDDTFSSAIASLDGVDVHNDSQAFSGADALALFGGTELDLSDAAIADPPARITAVALFGGIDIAVPEEWTVRMDVSPFLGGVSDDRSSFPEWDDPDLVVTGLAVFGGVSVRG